MTRVPASDRTRQRIAELFEGEFDKSELIRQAVRLLIEEVLEAEFTEELGRGDYARGG
jgi:transposase-like protein